MAANSAAMAPKFFFFVIPAQAGIHSFSFFVIPAKAGIQSVSVSLSVPRRRGSKLHRFFPAGWHCGVSGCCTLFVGGNALLYSYAANAPRIVKKSHDSLYSSKFAVQQAAWPAVFPED